MADSAAISGDPRSLNPNYDSGLSIPPFDADFFSFGDNQNDVVSFDDLDLDLDFDLDDLYLPSSDELDEIMDATDLQQFDLQLGIDQNNPQFAPDLDQLSHHEVFNSTCPEQLHISDEGDISGAHSLNGSAVLSSASPVTESHQISSCLNAPSSESNGCNIRSPEQCSGDGKKLNCPSPVSQGSGNYRSDVSDDLNYCANKTVSTSPNLSSSSIRVEDSDQKAKLEVSAKNNNVNSSLLKRKKGDEDLMMNNNVGSRSNKYMKSNCSAEGNDNNSHDEVGLSEEQKRKARLVRNRESAQLSRQRKKQYVDELEDKVKVMDSMIQDLNVKISYFMAENATLRQQMSGGGAIPPHPMATPPPGMYPYPGMMYPWMPYMVKPQGSQVPLVPIPMLKRKQPALAPKENKKVESKKNDRPKTKKVAGVSFLGLIFFIMLFGGLLPMVNVKYGGVKEAFTSNVGGGFKEKHFGRVLMVNGTESGEKYGDMREFRSNSNLHCGQSTIGKPSVDDSVRSVNESEPLVASLYVPRHNKLVKIDGNLVIHSVLASEKAMAAHVKEGGETGLAVPGVLSPAIRGAGLGRNVVRHPPLRALGSGSAVEDILESTETDGTVQQWFREGLTGPLLTSGMCTKVFEFDASSAIVPSPTSRNRSEERNQTSTHLSKAMNRRILRGLPIPLPESSHNISAENVERNSRKENLNGNNNSSSMVVSVLVDPREAGKADIDGVMGTRSISRVFVVVLIDSVKYVTYSCRLPFVGSAAPHLVTK